MTNLEYLNNEFNYLIMDSDKKEYLKECYKDIITAFKIEESDKINVAYRIGIVFGCINESRDNNDFDNLIIRASKKVSNYIGDDDDEEQRNENKINIEILSLIYKITKEDEFKKYSIDLDKFFEYLYRLLSFKPLTPLNGTEDEWEPNDSINPSYYINKRYSSVVADDNKGTNPKDICSRLYTRDDGNSWYSDSNEKPITFPYEVPTIIEKIYLEMFVKDIYGPSMIVNSAFSKEKKEGTPKYSEYCLGFLPSSSEGQYTSDDFKAKYALLLRVYDPVQNKIMSYDTMYIKDSITRVDAIKAFNEIKVNILENNSEVNGDIDLKELF